MLVLSELNVPLYIICDPALILLGVNDNEFLLFELELGALFGGQGPYLNDVRRVEIKGVPVFVRLARCPGGKTPFVFRG
jgi:hypothetical protein